MRFFGVFVGIDRYADVQVRYLTCARRDATALHALFLDTLGGGGTLLVDEYASRTAILDALDRLAGCGPDDLAVVAFSGHGSPSHDLVPYDADSNNLEYTGIPLGMLDERLRAIPARQVVCILDCCFSGGIEAKVLQLPLVPRSMASNEAALATLAGDGRVIITAARADQEAFEDRRLRHGFLTYHLLEALQGAEEVREGNTIPLYRLLRHVTQRVSAAAAREGKAQQPTVQSHLQEEPIWPVFRRGEHYRAAFPEHSRQPISADVRSLAGYGFPQDLIGSWARTIPSLNALQLAAINDFGLLDGENLVVSAPTSSGKTLVGELAALRGALERQRTFFLLPLKALVADKYRQFTQTYATFGIVTIRATGEIADDIPALLRGRYDICLMTYEKCIALLLGNPHLLDQVGTIVVDEVQMIADPSRGAGLEFLLTLLRMRRENRVAPQLIALSAVIGDTNGLEGWLAARLLRRTERPVPLDEGVLRPDGSFRYLDPAGTEHTVPCVRRRGLSESSQDWVIPLVRKLVDEGKQVIVFREQKGETSGCAGYLARELGLPPAEDALAVLPGGDPSTASAALRAVLSSGVAFHNADLDRAERTAIEEHFRAPGSALRVIVATTTLAMGVNTPAEAVIVVGLQHPGTPPTPYTVAEYKNIVGRAGRLGYVEHGTSYLVTTTPLQEHDGWERYVRGAPESLQSRFLLRDTDPRSLIVKVLVAASRVTGGTMDASGIVGFLEGSFGAFQQRTGDRAWTWDRDRLLAALADLEQHALVERTGTAYRLTELGRLAGEGGVEVETVVRQVAVLTPLPPMALTNATLVTAAQFAVEVDAMLFPLNKKSTQKEPQHWFDLLQQQQVPGALLGQLGHWSTEMAVRTLRAKKAIACLLWMTDQPVAQMERTLLQHGGAATAAGPIRSVCARLCDVLPTVARIAELVHPGLDLGDRLQRLLVRLEIGLPHDAVDLALVTGDLLARVDYLRLLREGCCTLSAVADGDTAPLLACLGGDATRLETLRRRVEQHRDRAHPAPLAPVALPPPGE